MRKERQDPVKPGTRKGRGSPPRPRASSHQFPRYRGPLRTNFWATAGLFAPISGLPQPSSHQFPGYRNPLPANFRASATHFPPISGLLQPSSHQSPGCHGPLSTDFERSSGAPAAPPPSNSCGQVPSTAEENGRSRPRDAGRGVKQGFPPLFHPLFVTGVR
jgi:hypothetical protein